MSLYTSRQSQPRTNSRSLSGFDLAEMKGTGSSECVGSPCRGGGRSPSGPNRLRGTLAQPMTSTPPRVGTIVSHSELAWACLPLDRVTEGNVGILGLADVHVEYGHSAGRLGLGVRHRQGAPDPTGSRWRESGFAARRRIGRGANESASVATSRRSRASRPLSASAAARLSLATRSRDFTRRRARRDSHVDESDRSGLRLGTSR